MGWLYLLYSILLFSSFIFTLYLGYNLFINLVYLEIAALSISVLLLCCSIVLDDQYIEFFVVIVITVVGAESAIAISFLISLNKLGVTLTSPELSRLKG